MAAAAIICVCSSCWFIMVSPFQTNAVGAGPSPSVGPSAPPHVADADRVRLAQEWS